MIKKKDLVVLKFIKFQDKLLNVIAFDQNFFHFTTPFFDHDDMPKAVSNKYKYDKKFGWELK